MLNLNYYLVETGENYCEISNCNHLIDFKEAKNKGRDNFEYKLGKLLLRNKRASFFKREDEFKIVYIDKKDKLCLSSFLQNVLDGSKEEPIFMCDDFNIHVIRPNQNLHITYKVYAYEEENRLISYPNIKQTSHKVKSKKRNQYH